MTRPARTSVGFFGSGIAARGCVWCVAVAGAVLLQACASGDGRGVAGARAELAIEAEMVRALDGSAARGAMTRAQRDRLAKVSAGLLASWLEETPGAYRLYMVGLGGTPRTDDAETELCERWMRESADLPWVEVRADEAVFRLPTIVDVEGERAVVIQGSIGKASWTRRGAYALPWEGVGLPPIDERLQVELHVPVVAPSGRVLEVMMTFVWVEERGIGWSPVNLWATGENIAGAAVSLPF